MDNVYLYDVDDLQTMADDCLQQRREEVAQCEAIIRTKVEALLSDRLRKL
jgi:glutamyl-tRNA reductase